MDCARAWTAHGPGLRTGLDWDIRTGRQKDEKWAWPGVINLQKVFLGGYEISELNLPVTKEKKCPRAGTIHTTNVNEIFALSPR